MCYLAKRCFLCGLLSPINTKRFCALASCLVYLFYGKEIGYRACQVCEGSLHNSLLHLLGFWQWMKAGLSCVFTEQWWLQASPFSLCYFFLHKIAYFSLHMGVLGTSEMFVCVICTPSVVSWHLRQVPKWPKCLSVGEHMEWTGS